MQAATTEAASEREVIDISSDTDGDGDDSVIETDADLFNHYLDLPVDDFNDFNPFLDLPYGPFENPFENLNGEPEAPVEDARPVIAAPPAPPVSPPDPEESYKLFLSKLLEVFPDHCRDGLKKLYDSRFTDGESPKSRTSVEEFAVEVILQIVHADKYPKETDRRRNLKRKRAESDNEDEGARYMVPGRQKAAPFEILEARKVLEADFVSVPLKFIDQQLKQHGNLYPAYLAIQQAEQAYDSNNIRLYQRLYKPRKSIAASDMSGAMPMRYGMDEFIKELSAARAKREKDEAKLKKKLDEERADAALEKECRETGNMIECQCCFTNTPVPKATHCKDGHFFCLECVLNLAKSRIELSRYDVICMDASGCKAEFSREERSRFLDSKLLAVLERLQQQTELREANLEDLESCPFCNYAEIYPPVQFDKEFRCRMPDCEAISCRLCKSKTHLPKTCAENKKEQGISERHIVEEAMTKALLKICPKCKVPILKDGGCNKLVCSQCRCYVCDFCGKDITKESYGHFDPNNGQSAATSKKCPTTDADYIRNKERIEKAEKEAMAKIRAENPDLSEDDLKVKFSTSVSNETNQGRLQGLHVAHLAQRRHAMRVVPERAEAAAAAGPNPPGGVPRRAGVAAPGPLYVPDMPFMHYNGALDGAPFPQYGAFPYQNDPRLAGFPQHLLNQPLQQPHRNEYQMNNIGQEQRAELEREWAHPPRPLMPNAGYAAEGVLHNIYNPLFEAAQAHPVVPLPQGNRGRVANQAPMGTMNNQGQAQAQNNLTPMQQFREAVQANDARMARLDEEVLNLEAAMRAITPPMPPRDPFRTAVHGGYGIVGYNGNTVPTAYRDIADLVRNQERLRQALPRPDPFADLTAAQADMTAAQARLVARAEREADHAQARAQREMMRAQREAVNARREEALQARRRNGL
ncbi:hypothetical protein MMC30_002620 [Trapelia coarctata]|nr:hypothetical protein [Trapelia coarctata]